MRWAAAGVPYNGTNFCINVVKAVLLTGDAATVAKLVEVTTNLHGWAIVVLEVNFLDPAARLHISSFDDQRVFCSIYVGIDPWIGFGYLFEVQLVKVDKTIHVLPTSKVDEDQSTCGKFIYIQGHPIYSQYSGWSVTFTFTNDKRLKAEGEFALYQVSITADYPATKTLFPNGPDTVYNYVQPVDLNNLPSVAETVYAHLNKSLSCTSEMKFIINDDAKQGPLASFKFTNLQVEAFKIYRSQLPAEVLHLTNVESNSASHKGSIESDEVEVEKY
ncbi:unnamed protein product [Nippostrongylus brasiliensis]|uniref:Movement protein n=1 Tax=Nippostrongylus brasiliensis TaxID=27835 RepID=A0A0N4YI00_NIPBR|nr:unnamed protein product [Nippostrongylus brasiliensis]